MKLRQFKFRYLVRINIIIIITLLALCFPIAAPVLSESTSALTPNASGYQNNIPHAYPFYSAHYSVCATNNGDSSFVYSTQSDQDYDGDLYSLTTLSAFPSGTINSITVHTVLRTGGAEPSQQSARALLRCGTSTSTGANFQLSTTGWFDYATTFNDRPGGGNWAWSDIDSLQAGVSIRRCQDDSDGDSVRTYCTQVYVVIDYTLSNNAPTDISLSNSDVAEDQPVNTLVGNLSTTDPDTGDTFIYSLAAGIGDTDNASFNITGAKLQTSTVFDYESRNSYSIRIRSTDQTSLSFEKQFTITITYVATNQAPLITLQPVDQIVIEGITATFSAAASGNPAPTVQWQVSTNGGSTWNNISGATSFTYTTPATTGGMHGYQYRAVFTNGTAPDATTNAATLTVNTAPVITTQPGNQTVTEGNAATFTAAATGRPTPTIQWQISINSGSTWTDIPGATNNTLIFTTVLTDDGSLYRAVFTNSISSATTTVASLSVNSSSTAPVVTTQPTNRTVNAGSTATFSAAASGNPAPTVQWQVSTNGGSTWNNISGATSSTYTTPATTGGMHGYQYRAVFTNGTAPDATTNAATLTVNTAPVITTQPGNQTVTEGNAATFTAAATGRPTPTIQWQISINSGSTWTDIPGATNNTLIFTTVLTDDGSLYRAVFTNSISSATTTVASLSVNSSSTAPVVTTQPTNRTVNVGSTATFFAAASGNPTPTVQWQVSGNGGSTWNNIIGATSSTYTTPATTGGMHGYQYRAIFTNSIGTTTTTAASLTVNPVITKLVFTLGTNQTLNTGTLSAPIIVQRQDNANQPVTEGLTNINLSTTSANGMFYSDIAGTTEINTIVINSGTSDTAVFYYKDTASGTPVLTASSGSLIEASSSFTIVQSGSSSGGGGGTQSLTISVQFTGIVPQGDFSLNSLGQTGEHWQLISTDGNCSLDIPSGTFLLDRFNEPLSSMEVTMPQTPFVPPAGKVIIAAYDFGPSGAKFDPEITITLKFDWAELPPDVDLNYLQVALWNGNTWEMIESNVDTQMQLITFKTNHFSTYAIVASDAVVVTTTTQPVLSTTPALPSTTLSVPASTPVNPTTTQAVFPTPTSTSAATSSFTISELTISPNEITPGESIKFGIILANTSDIPGSYTVVLNVDGQQINHQDVTLDGHTSQPIVFIAAPDILGNHTISIGGLTGNFTVVSVIMSHNPDTSSRTATQIFRWRGLIILVLVLLFILSTLISWFLTNRRRQL